MNVLCFLELALARSGCKCDFCAWSRARRWSVNWRITYRTYRIFTCSHYTGWLLVLKLDILLAITGERSGCVILVYCTCVQLIALVCIAECKVANDCYEQLQSTESLYHLIHNRNHLKKRWILSLDKDSVMESRKHWKALFLNFPQLQCSILPKGPSINRSVRHTGKHNVIISRFPY